jgi:magnesium chelatase family protein
MNPCPCGYLGDETRLCRCGPRRIQRYRDRLSGPLLDRLDLQIEVPRVELPALQLAPEGSRPLNPTGSGPALATAVHAARARQLGRHDCCNARLDHAGIHAHCRAQPAALSLLERVAGRFGLSARAYHRLLKVARTIADLQAVELIAPEHIGEAASLRLAGALDMAPGSGGSAGPGSAAPAY